MADEPIIECPTPNATRFGRSPTFQIVDTHGESDVYRDHVCGPFDLVLGADDRLSTDNQIGHHVLIRMAMRRRAADDDDVAATEARCGDRGGWWADAWRDNPTASRLWILEGELRTQENLRRADEMLGEALQDLIDIGVVDSFEFKAVYEDEGPRLLFDPLIAKRPTSYPNGVNWDWLWEDPNVGG